MVKWTPFLLYFLWSATNKANKHQDYTILMEINLGVPLLQRTRRDTRDQNFCKSHPHTLFWWGKNSVRTDIFVTLSYFFGSPGEIQKLGEVRSPWKNPETQPWSFPLSTRELHTPLFLVAVSSNTVSPTTHHAFSNVVFWITVWVARLYNNYAVWARYWSLVQNIILWVGLRFGDDANEVCSTAINRFDKRLLHSLLGLLLLLLLKMHCMNDDSRAPKHSPWPFPSHERALGQAKPSQLQHPGSGCSLT